MKHNWHEKGQYFTKNLFLQSKVYELIQNDPKCILEPSVGRGDLVDYVQSKKNDTTFDLYEIDQDIEVLKTINKSDIHFGDFLTQNIQQKYKTIIGNPPYVRTPTGNLYIHFIEKCYNLLENNGELIFIVPSDFIKLTSASKIINILMSNGTFTHIIHPHDEKLFENANIDVIVFRYCKNKELNKQVIYNDETKWLLNNNGILTFSDSLEINYKCLSEYFHIHVGLVTGKEDIFKNQSLGNIKMINDENKIEDYILVNEYPSPNKDINEYLLSNKDILLNRKIRKFTEKNWYEWGALRNIQVIKDNENNECIYVKNLTRSNKISFCDKVRYFGGGLLMMIPKEKINLQNVINYLNSNTFKENYMYSGRFKIGHKQLCNALIDPSIINK